MVLSMRYHFRDPFDFEISQNIISFQVKANGKFGPMEEFFNIGKEFLKIYMNQFHDWFLLVLYQKFE